MKRATQPVTIEKIKDAHAIRHQEIRSRLAEFEAVWAAGNDERLWEEMVFCFFTGGCSAKMGLRSVEAVRPFLTNGSFEDLSGALSGVHRYPFARACLRTFARCPKFQVTR